MKKSFLFVSAVFSLIVISSAAHCEQGMLRADLSTTPWVIHYSPGHPDDFQVDLPSFIWHAAEGGDPQDTACATGQIPPQEISIQCEGCSPDTFYIDESLNSLRIVARDLPAGTELLGVISAQHQYAQAADLPFTIVIEEIAVSYGSERALATQEEVYSGEKRKLCTTGSRSTSLFHIDVNTGSHTFPFYVASCSPGSKTDPDLKTSDCSSNIIDSVTFDSDTQLYVPVTDWEININKCGWVSTDGYSITIDTDASPPLDFQLDFRDYEGSDQFTVIVDSCSYTSYTTDSALNGVTILYARDSGTASYNYDTIKSINNCGYSAWTYQQAVPSGYSSLSDLGLSVDNTNDPAVLNIADYGNAAGPAPVTLTMTWNFVPDSFPDHATFDQSFTYTIYSPLTSLSYTIMASQRYFFIGYLYTIDFPTWTTTPADMSHLSAQDFTVSVDGVQLVNADVDTSNSTPFYFAWDGVTDMHFQIGIYTSDVYLRDVNYPVAYSFYWDDGFDYQTTVNLNFDFLLICAVYSLSTITAFDTTVSYTIFSGASTHSFATYTQVPACGTVPVKSLLYSTTSGGATSDYSSLVWVTSDVDTYLTIQTDDYTMDGQTFYLTHSYLYPADHGGDYTWTEEMAVTFTDPCTTTSFVSQDLPVIEQFIDISSKYPVASLQVTLPIIDDSVNVLYGASATSSICYTQTIQITEDSAAPTYIIVQSSSGSNVLINIETTDTTLKGTHDVKLTYTLDRYPALSIELDQEVILYQLEDPNTTGFDAQTYTVSEEALVVNLEPFYVFPESASILITYEVQQSDGTAVPSFITLTDNTSTVDLQFESVESTDVGEYTLVVIATATHTNLQVSSLTSQTISLEVLPAPDQFQANTVPFWAGAIPSTWKAYVGDAFNYTLPQVIDLEEDTTTITVDLDRTSTFMTYVDGFFSIEAGVTQVSNAGVYPIQIMVVDSAGSELRTDITFEVLEPEADDVEEEEEAEELSDALDFLNDLYGDPLGWSWGDQLAQLRNIKRIYKPIEPDVRISQITQKGEMTLEFTKDMIVPPLDNIRNATINMNGVEYQAIQLRVNPGDYSDMEDLKFSYNITSYTSREMKFKLLFEKPIYVSADIESKDYIEAVFYGNFYFFDTDGLLIEKQKTLRKVLPTMMPLGGASEALADSGESSTAATQALMGGNLAMNIILSASLQYLWAMINTQQIVLMLPLFKLSVPANASVFFGFLMEIAAFDIFPMDDLYDWMGFYKEEPLNPNLDSIGFGSTLFVYNVGSMIFALLMYPVMVIFVGVLSCCKLKKKTYFYRKKKSCKKSLFWGHAITTIFESYAVLSMCIFINLNSISFDDSGQWTSFVLTVIFLAVVVLAPPVIALVLCVKWKKVGNKKFDDQYGTLYELLNTERGRLIVLEPFTFLVRRLVLAFLCVWNVKLIFQVLIFFAFVIWQVVLIAYIRPYKDKQQHKLEYFNETVLMLLLYTFLCFSDMVADPETRFNMGYACISIVAAHLLFNLGLILYHNIAGCRDKCKQKRLEKIKAKRIAARAAQGQDNKQQVVADMFKRAAIASDQPASVSAAVQNEINQLEEIKEADDESEVTNRDKTQSDYSEQSDTYRGGIDPMRQTDDIMLPSQVEMEKYAKANKEAQEKEKQVNIQAQVVHMDDLASMFQDIQGNLNQIQEIPEVNANQEEPDVSPTGGKAAQPAKKVNTF